MARASLKHLRNKSRLDHHADMQHVIKSAMANSTSASFLSSSTQLQNKLPPHAHSTKRISFTDGDGSGRPLSQKTTATVFAAKAALPPPPSQSIKVAESATLQAAGGVVNASPPTPEDEERAPKEKEEEEQEDDEESRWMDAHFIDKNKLLSCVTFT